jgi:hypothetical protein
MNPQSLQTTSGMIYVGRLNSKPKMAGQSKTWKVLANEFVSYNNPRLCAAGKLALRGVKVDGIPYNMSELSNFEPLSRPNDDPFTWNDSIITGNMNTAECWGFAPIVVYNPDQIPLQFLVTVEWRVRFDPSNPAQAAHVQHSVASDSLWSKAIEAMASMGHGAQDIAAVVQRTGAFAENLVNRAGAIAQYRAGPLALAY